MLGHITHHISPKSNIADDSIITRHLRTTATNLSKTTTPLRLGLGIPQEPGRLRAKTQARQVRARAGYGTWRPG